MALIDVSIRHGQTQDEARGRLEHAVKEVTGKFGVFLHKTDWSEDRNRVTLTGPGMRIEMRVDADLVYVSGDLPILGGLLGSKLATGVRAILQKTFPKQLPENVKPR